MVNIKRSNKIYKSLKESLKEVKFYKEGKIQLDTWDDFLKELNKKD